MQILKKLLALIASTLLGHAVAADYAVVVSQKTMAAPGWKGVVEVLQKKHQAEVIVYTQTVSEAQGRLQALFPRYACFVAQPEEPGRVFVASVHQLTRSLDPDPYTDCFWGIVTGYDAAAALRVAETAAPLTVHKVASGTAIALDRCEEGICYDELVKGKVVRKEKGEQPVQSKGPDDSTAALAATLTEYQADLFITSGHATERDWQIGYRYRNGTFRCADGKLYGLDTQKEKHPIQSPNPKVYMPVGNCLMGHIDGKDAMAIAWMNSGGVRQMFGYTVPSWYGYAGWGCLDYFLEQPGRYTFCEAFFANEQALIYRLQRCAPGAEKAELDSQVRIQGSFPLSTWAQAEQLNEQDVAGLAYDRDTLAFYGDPAWIARMAPGPLAWQQALTEKDGVWTFTIQPAAGEKSFAPINTNGSQRGYRPFIAFLPRQVSTPKVLEGADLQPVITRNFILVPNPKVCDPSRTYRVTFRAGA